MGVVAVGHSLKLSGSNVGRNELNAAGLEARKDFSANASVSINRTVWK